MPLYIDRDFRTVTKLYLEERYCTRLVTRDYGSDYDIEPSCIAMTPIHATGM